MELILASASARRQQMLTDLRIAFRIEIPDIDESRLRGEPAVHYVERLAQTKAMSVALKHGFITAPTASRRRHAKPESIDAVDPSQDWAILAADTIVVLGNNILGKPTDQADGVRMLKKLSGRTHEVITGFCWLGNHGQTPRSATIHVRTKVTFADMPTEFWKWYVSTGEPMDKAGAYAAQGIGVSFIEKVSGSYSNVIGLPLPQVLKSFSKLFGGDLREYCGAAD